MNLHILTCPLLVLLGLTAGFTRNLSAGESGLALGPALILVRDVPPGRAFTLHEAAKVRYTLINNSDQVGDFEVVCSLPVDAGMRNHEIGYEAPADLGWFTLDKKVVTLAGHAQTEIDFQVNIPDLPENYNRHYMVYIDAGSAKKAGIGATLRLRARVMLETKVKEDVGDAIKNMGDLGIVPGTVQMKNEGKTWGGQALIRNNTDRPTVYDVLRIDKAIAESDADKRARYYSHASMATRDMWSVADVETVSLEANTQQTITFSANSALMANAEGLIEEVMFIARRAPENADPKQCRELAGRSYDYAGLVRLQYELPQKEGAVEKP